MGVVEGISGVVLRPIEGAKQQGVGGFFSGAVKGVVGLVRGVRSPAPFFPFTAQLSDYRRIDLGVYPFGMCR